MTAIATAAAQELTLTLLHLWCRWCLVTECRAGDGRSSTPLQVNIPRACSHTCHLLCPKVAHERACNGQKARCASSRRAGLKKSPRRKHSQHGACHAAYQHKHSWGLGARPKGSSFQANVYPPQTSPWHQAQRQACLPLADAAEWAETVDAPPVQQISANSNSKRTRSCQQTRCQCPWLIGTP